MTIDALFLGGTSIDLILKNAGGGRDRPLHNFTESVGGSITNSAIIAANEETLKFIRYLKKRHVFISYDPNIRPGSIKHKNEVKNRVLKLLKLADLAKLSQTDLEYLTGQKNPLKGLEMLKKQVKCEIVLTLGAKGSIYHSRRVVWKNPDDASGNSRFIKVPAFKVKVADTIGAGDAFTAGLIYRLIKQGRAKFFANMKANIIFASAVSALICTQKGSHQGLKNLKQVNSFLAKHGGVL